MDKIELKLNKLNCASCAGKIEKFSGEINGVREAKLDFLTKKLKVDLNEGAKVEIIKEEIKGIINKLEPDVIIIDEMEEKIESQENHDHDHNGIKRNQIIGLIISAILFSLPFLLGLEGKLRVLAYVVSYLIVGHKVIIKASKNVLAGVAFDENFLMTIATIGAFVIGEYPEAVAVMLFYQVGEIFQGMAVNHSRRSISSLLDIRPDYANLEKNGEISIVNPEDVHIGDYILIRPGEKVPLDGIIIEGNSSLDTSNITGESLPRNVNPGDEVLSGVVNNQGLLKVKVSKEFSDSTVSKILNLVENASSKKAPTENFITKFARIYTPVVVFLALGIAIIPPLLKGGNFMDWIYNASVFLVISCPCALVISIPLGFFGGIGGSSKAGILVKGGNYLEALTNVDTIVFDKTGTITKGTFKVTEIFNYYDYSKDEILEIAAYGEFFSNHPIGKSIIEEYGKEIKNKDIKFYKEISGKGIEVFLKGEKTILGNKSLFNDNNIDVKESKSIGTVVYIGKDNKHIGTVVVSDELKDKVVEDMKKLKLLGIKETIMLSGDNEKVANEVGKVVGLDRIYGNLLPQDKVRIFEDIIKENKSNVIFVGDGVNDAPVIARADIGIAMGGLGSDAAIEAADIVIMTDEIGKIGTAIKIARNTKKIVSQNIVLALALKIIILALGAIGKATMWQAVFADVGVSIIAILNSIRALKVED